MRAKAAARVRPPGGWLRARAALGHGVPLGARPARPDAQCGHLEGGPCGRGVDGIAAVPPELLPRWTRLTSACASSAGATSPKPQDVAKAPTELAVSSAPLQSTVIHRDLDLRW